MPTPRPNWDPAPLPVPEVPTTAEAAAEPFHCPAHRCTLSAAACVARWRIAEEAPESRSSKTGKVREKSSLALHRLQHGACYGCAAGAARAELLGDNPEVRLPELAPLDQAEDQMAIPDVPPALRTHEPFTSGDIREALYDGHKLSDWQLREIRGAWQEAGLVERTGQGPATRYRWVGDEVTPAPAAEDEAAAPEPKETVEAACACDELRAQLDVANEKRRKAEVALGAVDIEVRRDARQVLGDDSLPLHNLVERLRASRQSSDDRIVELEASLEAERERVDGRADVTPSELRDARAAAREAGTLLEMIEVWLSGFLSALELAEEEAELRRLIRQHVGEPAERAGRKVRVVAAALSVPGELD